MFDQFTLTVSNLISRNTNQTSNTVSSTPTDPIKFFSPYQPEKIITFVGAASAGKSSTINAILNKNVREVSIGHGTTKSIERIVYKNGYHLCDTPGLMDKFSLTLDTKSIISKSEAVIYICTGQLYREELMLLKKIHNFQQQSNNIKSSRKRKLAIYVNKRDLSNKMMPPNMVSKEEECIHNQVSHFIETSHIVYGTSSPFEQGKYITPNIEQLQKVVESFLV